MRISSYCSRERKKKKEPTQVEENIHKANKELFSVRKGTRGVDVSNEDRAARPLDEQGVVFELPSQANEAKLSDGSAQPIC